MRNVFTYYDEKDYLAHYGIKGQKWGVRRFQNPDGTLTDAGKVRYGSILTKNNKHILDESKKSHNKILKGRTIKEFDSANYHKALEEQRAFRQKVYASSKKCNDILNRVRALRKKYINMDNKEEWNEKEYQRNLDELFSLSKEFRKASKEVFTDLLKASGNEQVKYIDSKYTLSDVLSEQAELDDFWEYVYGDRN